MGGGRRSEFSSRCEEREMHSDLQPVPTRIFRGHPCYTSGQEWTSNPTPGSRGALPAGAEKSGWASCSGCRSSQPRLSALTFPQDCQRWQLMARPRHPCRVQVHNTSRNRLPHGHRVPVYCVRKSLSKRYLRICSKKPLFWHSSK